MSEENTETQDTAQENVAVPEVVVEEPAGEPPAEAAAPSAEEAQPSEPVAAPAAEPFVEVGLIYAFEKPSVREVPEFDEAGEQVGAHAEDCVDKFFGRVQSVDPDNVFIQILNGGNFSNTLRFEKAGLTATQMDASVAYNLSINPRHYG